MGPPAKHPAHATPPKHAGWQQRVGVFSAMGYPKESEGKSLGRGLVSPRGKGEVMAETWVARGLCCD